MNGSSAGAFRVTVRASGFVLDTPVIGAAEAAGRVLALWQDGAALRLLPHGAWLLRLPAPVEVRADRAPGLPLVERAGALVAVGVEVTAGDVPVGDVPVGEVVLPVGGTAERHRLAALPELRPAEWLDVEQLTVHHLAVLDAELEPDPVLEEIPERPAPDLRAAARVRPKSRRAALAASGAGSPALSWRPAAGVLLGLAVLLFATAVLLPTVVLLSHPWLVAALGAGVIPGRWLAGLTGGLLSLPAWALLDRYREAAGTRPGGPKRTGGSGGSGGSGAGTGAGGRSRVPRSRRLRGLFARLAMTTPAASVVRGRHARYLRELTAAFEQRRWEDALREALALSAGTGPDDRPGLLSLRLPQRRTRDLRPSPHTRRTAVSPLSGPTVHQHLADLYRKAAETLEREGRIEEAAFVLADLLGAGAEAVTLLERSGRLRQAAELAEGRGLGADLVVRLWWRAGERDRAARIARSRGGFARAVERLTPVDAEAARELREAWVRSCQEAGDRLGAVEAAWPEPDLRPMVVGELRDCVALDGPLRARALGYLLALGAGPATRTLALETLNSRDPLQRDQRGRLATALAGLPCAEPAVDRELATAAARAVVRDGGFTPTVDPGTQRRLFTGLLERADPLTAADLRAPRTVRAGAGARAGAGQPLEVTAAAEPGTLPVLDAAVLDSGAVLVACGDAGVRLLAPDGRTRARWDAPAHQLVLADHGTVALLVARYGEVSEIARLDLATRAVRPWTRLRARQILSSFDGRLLTVVDEDGLTVLDTLAARPTVVWRELDRDALILGTVARTPAGCSALVASGGLRERWRWELPDWQLRSRHPLEEELPAALLACGTMLSLQRGPVTGGSVVRWHGEHPDAARVLDEAPGAALCTDGDLYATVAPLPDGAARVEAGVGLSTAPTLRATFPGTGPALISVRQRGSIATVWHRDGRVLGAEADGSALLANLRMTVG